VSETAFLVGWLIYSNWGYLSISPNEVYTTANPRHILSTISWSGYPEMIEKLLMSAKFDEREAILRERFLMRQHNQFALRYMYSHLDIQEVFSFMNRVDSFIRVAIKEEVKKT
jgi:hypothetical protein